MIDLRGVVDTSFPGCGVDAPCIDPAFGATGDNYWSVNQNASNPSLFWYMDFDDGVAPADIPALVRAVRNAF